MRGDATNWDEEAYRERILREREAQTLTVFRTAWAPSPDPIPDAIVVASSDGSIASYSISSCASKLPVAFGYGMAQRVEPTGFVQAHDGPAYDVKFYGSGEDALLLRFSANIPDVLFSKRGPWGALSPIPENNAIALDTQGASIFSAAGDSCAYCWDVETCKIKMVFKGHLDYLHCIVSRNSSNQACSSGQSLLVWNLHASECVSRTSTAASMQDMIFDKNQVLAVGSEPFLNRFDLNGKILSQIPCAPQSAFSVSLHPSGVISYFSLSAFISGFTVYLCGPIPSSVTAIGGYGGLVDVISQFGVWTTKAQTTRGEKVGLWANPNGLRYPAPYDYESEKEKEKGSERTAETRKEATFSTMAGQAPDGANNFDAKSYDLKMNELLSADGQDFFASYDEVHETFDSMGLQENLLRGIYAYGFEKPSAIQQRGIVPFCKGLDVIQQAQSGTGKTATFCSGILQQLDYALVECQALVLAPTRELAQQIEKVMRALGDYLGVKVHACVGGTSVREDQRILSSGVHVVVGTPGRVFDMLRRQSLRADSIKMFVLDEADEMLSRGFKDQIYDIFQLLPPKIQVGVFSATMPPEALDITRKFMNKPVRILVKREELTLEGIKQFHVNVDKEEWKLETLCDLYETLAITQSVIFVNTRRKVDWLTDKMRSRDHTVSATHGDMDQNTRDIIMREFRSGSSRVLITTDLLARGIDVQQVSLVINYDLPTQPENYLHRIGRGGRFGRKGVAINFVTKDDERMLFDIQKFYNVVIEELPANVADLL
ncbi:unnamed protein product [Linum tenue]|uniref:RNA helicase n=2 Tax=Linum TaxID=4005 RepID=A0AAV0S466_9ROSI|nr:unnamed protein product [Linum tenue]